MTASPTSSARLRRLLAGAAAGTLILAACGGGDSDDAASDDGALPAVEQSTDAGEASGGSSESTGEAAEAPAGEGAVPVAVGPGLLDLLGPDVEATAETPTNELPDVVVDDLNNGRKVNFRNLVPQDKPILLWMWAPH